jgi:TP901 family phage tail tape measure protein
MNGQGNSAFINFLIMFKMVNAKEVETSTNKMGTAMEQLKNRILKTAGTIMITAPTFMLLRNILFGITGAIQESWKVFYDFEKEMGRVATATQGTSKDLDDMRRAAINFSAGASRGFKEAATAMYVLGSAGFSVKEQIAGLKPIMNLTIGSMGNVEETAKAVAGAYNIYKDSLGDAMSEQEKFLKITDTMAYVFTREQVEVEDLATAFSYVGAAGNLMNIDFDTLTATIGFLNTNLVAGSKAGTSFFRVLTEIASKPMELQNIGIAIDPDAPLQVVDVIRQLHEIYGTTINDVKTLKTLTDTFGQIGAKAAITLIKKYDDWSDAINRSKDEGKGFGEQIRKTFEDTLPGAMEKFGSAWKANVVNAFEATKDPMKNIVSFMGEFLQQTAETYNNILGIKSNLELISKLEDDKSNRKKVDRKLDITNVATSATPFASQVGTISGAIKFFNLEDSILNLFNAVKDKFEDGVAFVRKQHVLEEKILETLAIAASTFNVISMSKVGKTATDAKVEQLKTGNLNPSVMPFGQDKSSRSDMERKMAKSMGIETSEDRFDAERKAIMEVYDVQKQKVKSLEQEFKYNVMITKGVEGSKVSYEKISDTIETMNAKIKIHNDGIKGGMLSEEQKAKSMLKQIDIMDVIKGNYDSMSMASSKLNSLESDRNNIIKERNSMLIEQLKILQEYNQGLKDTFKDSLKGTLAGGDFTLFKDMQDKVKEQQQDAFATALTDKAFASGGFGDQLATAMGVQTLAMKDIFSKAKTPMEKHVSDLAMILNQHVQNFAIAAKGGTPGGVGADTMNQASDLLSKFGGTGTQLSKADALSKASTESRMAASLGKSQSKAYSSSMGASGGGTSGMTMAGAAKFAGGALGIYGGVQGLHGLDNNASRGKPVASTIQGAASGAAVGIAAGAMMGAALGPIGMALGAVYGLAMGMKAPKKWREVTVQEEMKEVATRIDVSNKELQMVNRNLVALRQEITYILPSSAYLSERGDVVSEYSINRRR